MIHFGTAEVLSNLFAETADCDDKNKTLKVCSDTSRTTEHVVQSTAQVLYWIFA